MALAHRPRCFALLIVAFTAWALCHSRSPTALASPRQRIFQDGDLARFRPEQLVPVDRPWKVLLNFIITEENRIALIRAPPRSGKSFLGQLSGQRGLVPPECNVEVRYCPNVANDQALADLLRRGPYDRGPYEDIFEMAKDSRRSRLDESRKTIVYFFDETHDIPTHIVDAFVSNGDENGYAVFATAGRAAAEGTLSTPRELSDRTFYYRSPVSNQEMRSWLEGRFRLLIPKMPEPEVQATAELIMNIANGGIGLVTFLACRVEDAQCKTLGDVREQLAQTLERVSELHPRVFGTQNGQPDEEQARLVSMLRCCGGLQCIDAAGHSKDMWRIGDPSHRMGLSKAFFAPRVAVSEPLSRMSEDCSMTFVHSLQPEAFKDKFSRDWAGISLESRWVLDFAHNKGRRQALPEHVTDLVISWLSHVSTDTLLYAPQAGSVDASEGKYQESLDLFVKRQLHMRAAREQRSGGGFLDHFIDQNLGIELLIRPSGMNNMKAKTLLGSKQVINSLVEHAQRGDGRYSDIAKQCTKGYITVFPATLTNTAADDEWEAFQELAKQFANFSYPVLVAVAPFGWAKWEGFLHRPGQEPIRFEIPRQRLMLKLVDDQVVSARAFYPSPQEVWVQPLRSEDGVMKKKGRAFEVKPDKDSIAALARAIRDEDGLTCGLSQLQIFRQNWEGEWEEETKMSQVLYENTEEKPYGFLVSSN